MYKFCSFFPLPNKGLKNLSAQVIAFMKHPVLLIFLSFFSNIFNLLILAKRFRAFGFQSFRNYNCNFLYQSLYAKPMIIFCRIICGE